MSRQLWVRIVKDGVPHECSVESAEQFEAQGWVRDGTPPFRRVEGRPRRADGARTRREWARALEGVTWPSVELQRAVRASDDLVIELYCEGSKKKPHDREEILTLGRKINKHGIFLLSKAVDGPRWETVEGPDGFRYHPDRSNGKVDATTVRCPQPRCSALNACDLTSARLNALADAILSKNGGKAERVLIEYRKLADALGPLNP